MSTGARRLAALLLVLLATATAFLSLLAWWARHQVLDGPAWADTSVQVLRDAEVRRALSTHLAQELAADATARAALAPRLLGASAVARDTPELRAAIERTAGRILREPAAQDAWRAANLAAQREFTRILDGDGGAVTVRGDRVILDLREVVRALAVRVGLPGSEVDRLPAGSMRIVVMRSRDIADTQDGLRAIRGLSIVLPLLTLLLWALALVVAGRRRGSIVAWIGVGAVAAAVAALIARSVVGERVLDELVRSAADRPAADHVWAISTSLLRDAAIWVLLAGVALAAGGAIAALAARRHDDPAAG